MSYGFELDIPEEAMWKEKLNVFKVLIPLMKTDSFDGNDTAIINVEELKNVFKSTCENDLHIAYLKSTPSNNLLQKNYTFYNNEEFYRFTYDHETFRNLLDMIRDTKDLKVYLDAVRFYIQHFSLDNSLAISPSSTETDIDKAEEKRIIEDIKSMGVLDEENLPKNFSDVLLLYFCAFSNGNSTLFQTLFTLINNGLKDYSSVMTKNSLKNLIDGNIIDIHLIEKTFIYIENNINIGIADINSKHDLIKYIFSTFIELKVSTIPARKHVINLIDKYQKNDNYQIKFLVDILNEILLEDTPNTNNIKSDMIKMNLDLNAGGLEDNDGFFA